MTTPKRSRGLRLLGRLIAALALGACAFLAWFAWTWSRQGLRPDELDPGLGARVDMDEHGIPTIVASNWLNAAEAQGYVVAAERMWQMDLMRRAAGGGLSEWFGEPAIEADRAQLLEDWPGVSERLADALPADQREPCDAYARGVNRFIETAPKRWGVEYTILRAEPRPWRCADSMLLMMAMARDLSKSSDDDLDTWGWRAALNPSWEAFLFPEVHPWNLPLFGEPGPALELPEPALQPGRALPTGPDDAEITPGSNNWAWRGSTGAFLANDPHLGANVPHLWYLLRLYVSADEWGVGSAIPGIPGIVLGMNSKLAWSFTNTAEDVDDLVIEELDATGERYVSHLESDADGQPQKVWAPVEHRALVLRVKGGEEIAVDARFTERGPLSVVNGPDGPVSVSRLWLPFQDPKLVAHAPGFLFLRARSLDEMQAAIDHFRFPAQNVLVMDRAGSILYRTSGLGVRRVADGATPGPALTQAWAGLETPDQRPRLLIPSDTPGPVHLETANARIWAGPWHHGWASDDRTARIRALLSGRDDLTVHDMEQFQMDTGSPRHRMLLQWVSRHLEPLDGGEEATLRRWAAWDGQAIHDEQTFSEALAVERSIRDTLLLQVRRSLLPPALMKSDYYWSLDEAWILRALGLDDPAFQTAVDWEEAEQRMALDRFGIQARDLARAALSSANDVRELYSETNRWAAQHPFVGRVPLLGDWFAIGTPAQHGWPGLVRSERPRGGASVRFVWDLRDPARSSWITPVGQSGHVRSPHFSDLQALFHADQRLPVFDRTHDWGF